ncbi:MULTISPECIES: DUF6404 family protein [unclassified Pantoea]|jgi:hypothetical protein|uniref:DUF6404 family protein n=1 Tax=unclassified Pantoea TaxID=2630326 RepID=UPI00226AC5F7|nr:MULTISPECIES: DUF6404 family protein [unclassified Pantoea]
MKETTFERKKARALALLAETKMWRSHYAPPLYRLLWKMKIPLPPPTFCPFWFNFLFFGGMAMLFVPAVLIFPALPDLNVYRVLLIPDLAAGVLFGLPLALFHAWRKRVFRLPAWKSL